MRAPIVGGIIGAGIVTMPMVATAHTGVDYVGHGESFLGGFFHPIVGIDHLVAMVSIGLWAAYLGGRAQLLVPLSFTIMMIAGALLKGAGVELAVADQAIAASIVVFGLMICMLAKISIPVAAALVGTFAVFHGHAHGAEIPELARPLLHGAGFIAATVFLLFLGAAFGKMCQRSVPNLIVRAAGAAVLAFGIMTVLGYWS